MSDFGEICRVCMQRDQKLLLIFNKSYQEESTSIATMLETCTKYKVLAFDGLPQHVCSECLKEVKIAYRFKQKCEQSYHHLMQIITESNNGNHVDNEIYTYLDKETQTCWIHPCEHCDQKFNDLDDLRIHRIKDHKGSSNTCRFCFKTFNRVGYLRSHIAIVHPESGCKTTSQCQVCHRRFSRKSHMLRHMKVIHKIVPTHNEVEFYDKFEEDANYSTEYNINEGDIEIKEEYDILEENPMNVIEPMHTVLIDENMDAQDIKLEEFEEEDVIGEDCEESIIHADEAKNEDSYSSSSSNISKETKEKKPKSSAKQKLFNKVCKKKHLANKTEYKNQRDPHHEEKKYSCKTCDMSFSRRSDLREHVRHCQKKYSCRECAQVFNSIEELAEHRKSEGHDRPMLCPECGLRCKSSSSLAAHMRRHNGEKPFKCKYCNKGFARSDDVKIHEKYHTGEKSHFCDICGKGFQRKYNLTIHLRVHTGEKPYKCPHCPQAFSQSNDLKSHIRRHTGERFRCDFCDASFLHGYQIRQHKVTAHGIKEGPLTQRVKKFTSEEQIKEKAQKQQDSS